MKKIKIMVNNIYEWISKIIQSANNDFHFEAVDKLIELFFEKFQDEDLKLQLEIQRTNRWNEIHNIL